LFVGDALVERYASADNDELTVKLTPGAEIYYQARADGGLPFAPEELVGAVIVAAIGGHPDKEGDRNGTALSAVWSHHLAVVRGEDPKLIAKTFAPTETKVSAWRIQKMAGLGVRVSTPARPKS
jgi:hypothetical protein